MVELVVVLHLIVWDADTGKQLAAFDHTFDNPFEIVKTDKIEACRVLGVSIGEKATAQWRKAGYPNAFTNVNCQWERKREQV